tara:strand:- start:1568 stop:3268 length:1701 start_codon:yes stop_codon:yes gene_type:complete
MIQFSLTRRFFKVFTKEEKLIFFSLLFINFITAILELLSIAALIPIFKSVTDPDWNEKYFSFINEELRIIFIFVAVIILYIVKNIVLVGTAYISGKFQNKVTLRVVKDVYNSYLNKKYEFHINNHSSVLLRNMEYMNGIDGIFMRLVGFYSDLILAIMAFILVLSIDTQITIIAFALISIILLTYSTFTRLNITKFGSNSQNYNTSYMKNMMEGIVSFKEILLSGKQKFFTDRNEKYKEQALRYNLKFTLIELIPKHLLELVFVFSTLGITYYFVIFEKIDLNEYIPYIGAAVIGLLKFLPNILRIFSSHQQFNYLLPQIDIINENIFQINQDSAYGPENEPKVSFVFKKKIEFKNVKFKYSDKNIIDNINFLIEKNSFVGIKGESGSGKSTILNILTGLITPTEGEILIDGKSQNLSTRVWQKKIGFVSQNTHLLDDTIKTNIAFGSDEGQIDEKLMEDCIKKSGLENFIKNLDKGINTVVGENGTKISGGQIQRIGIARAFYKKPEILILDEPTNSLDEENEKKIIETLKKLKNDVTMIIVSHDEEPLKITDKKILIKNGRLVS